MEQLNLADNDADIGQDLKSQIETVVSQRMEF